METRQVTWVFDVISPFAYLQLHQLPPLPNDVRLELVPVLFAGILNHYGQIGPAESGHAGSRVVAGGCQPQVNARRLPSSR